MRLWVAFLVLFLAAAVNSNESQIFDDAENRYAMTFVSVEGEDAEGPSVRWRCWAESRWGDMFSSIHESRHRAMDRALDRCEWRTRRRCYPAGCERVISWP